MPITLDSTLVQQTVIGGTIAETNTTAAITEIKINYTTNLITFTLQTGIMVNNAFVAGQHGTPIVIVINTITGLWNMNNGASGQVTAIGLTNLNNALITARNNIESATVIQNMLLGIITPWPAVV